jgi:bacillithiol biosynthesis cysteine-adding enzyme BshC
VSTDRLSVDLASLGLLPPLPASFLSGRALELVSPLRIATEIGPAETAGPDRRALAAGLASANAAYGHPRADELAAKLADPATRVVATGQQPGLFGGPLYTLSKAVAAALAAERLEATGVPAVAVFWVATEDHDFLEVAQAAFAGPEGLVRVGLGEDTAPLLPVGMRTLGPAVSEALVRLGETVPGERFGAWLERLAVWYRPEARFGEAFSRLLADLLGERGPLLADAMLPAVKAAEQPVLARMVARRHELEEAFAARDEQIRGAGFDLQVAPQRGASPLFVVRGETRRRVEWRGAQRFGLRGDDRFEESVSWLEGTIAENPAAVSAGVMGRVAVQDAIFGTSLLVLGPGEASYIPQVAPAYDVLDIPAPAVLVRPQALVLPSHQIDKLSSFDLTLTELLSDDFDVDAFLAGGESTDLVAPTERTILAELDALKDRALAVDKNLEQPWAKTRQQVEKALGAFASRLTAAAARRDEVARARLEDLLAACLPEGRPQERVISTAHFPGKYGSALVEAFFDQLQLDPTRLQVITP